MVTAGGVLDQHPGRRAAGLGGVGEGLAPVVDAGRQLVRGSHVPAMDDQALGPDRLRGCRVGEQQLAAGDPDPVVQGGDVDDVRGGLASGARRVRVDLTREALLDARQAGELLGVKASTITAWAREGRLPCLRLGPRVIRWTREIFG